MTAKSRAPDCLVVAHRGASADAPENTLPAFALAWDQQADAVEADFRLCGDGQIVCIHDPDTSRVAGVPLVVAKTPMAQLSRLDVGSWYDARWQGVRIPTLSDVLRLLPSGKLLYLEMKSGPEIVTPLLRQLDDSGCDLAQLRIIAMDAEVINQVKQQAPHLKAFWLSSIKADSKGRTAPDAGRILDTLRACRADGFGSSYSLITQDTVERILAAGFEYHVWTVDDAAIAQRFKRWGAASVTSNIPGVIRPFLGPG